MSVTISRPVRRRPQFHPLPVDEVRTLTDEAVAVTFAVPAHLRELFAFRPGQHLTVRRMEDGEDVRRSYSISSTPAELAAAGVLRIGIKRIPGGLFSRFAAEDLSAGATIEVLPPLGHFTTAFSAARCRHYGFVAAGSGITPILSLLATGLATEPDSRFTLLFGNRYARSVMFAEELADLKDRFPARLHVVHVLSREAREADLLSGRLDGDRLARLFGTLVDVSDVDEWFLCGPYGMVVDARAVLASSGVPETAVHTELFHVEDAPVPTRGRTAERDREGRDPTAGAATTEVTVILDGRTSTVTMGRDERVLDAALRVRPELPFACKGGVCSTCRARLLEGEVEMARNFALEPDEVASGYVLTCQSRPLTPKLVVDYDA